MIKLKSAEDIERLTEGGTILSEVLDILEQQVVVGAVPRELDMQARKLIAERDCVPAFLDYAPRGHKPFPAALCVSVNDVVVHGLPTDDSLKEGDLMGLDLGLIYRDKYYLDSARTVGVGVLSEEAKHLLAVTKEALRRGIEAAQPGNTIGDIGSAVQMYVERESLEVVKQLVGHGVGFDVHEEPQVPNYGTAGEGAVLEPGLVIAIEPMVTVGDATVTTARDGWGVMVKTGNLTAHQEHTVAVTEAGPKVLTTT